MTCLFKDSGYLERVPTWSSYLHMHRRSTCTPRESTCSASCLY